MHRFKMELVWAIRDILWLAHALWQGKVRSKKEYQPQSSFFRAVPGTTSQRMVALMRCWGYRPATLPEIIMSFLAGQRELCSTPGTWSQQGIKISVH